MINLRSLPVHLIQTTYETGRQQHRTCNIKACQTSKNYMSFHKKNFRNKNNYKDRTETISVVKERAHKLVVDEPRDVFMVLSLYPGMVTVMYSLRPKL